VIMRTLGRLSTREYDELKRRQAQLFKEDLTPRPAPRSPRSRRARNAQPLSAEQIEASILRALRDAFTW